jgi:hypothetical protein
MGLTDPHRKKKENSFLSIKLAQMVKIHEYSDYNVDTVFRQGVVVVPEKLVHDAELNEVLQNAIKVFPLKKNYY